MVSAERLRSPETVAERALLPPTERLECVVGAAVAVALGTDEITSYPTLLRAATGRRSVRASGGR
jgi:hypothetical protein